MTGWLVLLAPALGLVAAVAVGPLLRSLPVPDDSSADTYRSLASRRFAAGCGVIVSASVITGMFVDPSVLWSWVAFVVVGSVIAVIDAQTGFVPTVLAHTVLLLVIAGMFVAAATGGASVLRLGVAAACGAVSWLVFAGLWVATRGGIGFGDVRFIPSLALATAAHSVTLLFAALIVGTVIALCIGVLARWRGASGFPYTPGLMLGALVAPVILWCVGQPG